MLGSNLNIMNSQWLDVIFKDRNQAYGAYQLRRDNAANTNKALMIAIGLFVSALSIPTILNMIHGVVPDKDPVYKRTEVINHPEIEVLHQKVEEPAKQQKQVRSQHNTVQDQPLVVMQDYLTKQDPPTQTALKTADPGPVTSVGDPGAIVNIGDKVGSSNIIGGDSPGDGDGKSDFLVTAEFNPEYPGGDAAFNKYLSTHIRYPNVAKENGIQGRVFIQFIVERDGGLTDLKALRDPGSGLGDEAMRVLKTMPHWKPGKQNGKPVRVQFTVPVNFSLAE
jgi:protein TonB